jgi:hypothetical protein
MDRMPKEYKIIVYLTIIHIIYSTFYFAALFFKFAKGNSPLKNYIIVFSLPVIFFFAIMLFLFYKKKALGRFGLIAAYIVEGVVYATFIFGLIFFKDLAKFLARKLSTDIFTFYLILASLGISTLKGIIAFIIMLAWSVYLIYLLAHKEVKKFIKEKTYPPVNTQKYTLLIMSLYFASLVLITFLINL